MSTLKQNKEYEIVKDIPTEGDKPSTGYVDSIFC